LNVWRDYKHIFLYLILVWLILPCNPVSNKTVAEYLFVIFKSIPNVVWCEVVGAWAIRLIKTSNLQGFPVIACGIPYRKTAIYSHVNNKTRHHRSGFRTWPYLLSKIKAAFSRFFCWTCLACQVVTDVCGFSFDSLRPSRITCPCTCQCLPDNIEQKGFAKSVSPVIRFNLSANATLNSGPGPTLFR